MPVKNAPVTFLWTIVLAGAAVVWLVACAEAEPPAAQAEPVAEPPLEVTVPGGSLAGGSALEQMIELAKADLAQRIGVDPDSIILVDARAVTWRSGALGCPQPGMMYTDALVPGVSISLRVDGNLYSYHGGPGNDVFYCPETRVEQPAPGTFPEHT